jgi:hypothetical protein
MNSKFSNAKNKKHDPENYADITEENSLVDEKENDNTTDNLVLLDSVYISNPKQNYLKNLHYRTDNSVDSFEVRKNTVVSRMSNSRLGYDDDTKHKRNKTSGTGHFNDLDNSDNFTIGHLNREPLYSEAMSGHLVSALNDISHIKPPPSQKKSIIKSIKSNNISVVKPTSQSKHFTNASINISNFTNSNTSKNTTTFPKKKFLSKNGSIDMTIDENCDCCRNLKSKIVKLCKDKMDLNLENSGLKKDLSRKKEELIKTTKKLDEKTKQAEKDAGYILKQEKEIRRLFQVIEKMQQNIGVKNRQNNHKLNSSDDTYVVDDPDHPYLNNH